jgi:predicted phosphodiesterase
VRVAVVSDIHGNLPALDAVLAEIEGVEADAVVCCGDVVGAPFSSDVFDRLAALPNLSVVRGNADRMVLEGSDEFGVDWAGERQRLGEDRLAALASWPLTVELDVDGLGRTLFCHAGPAADEPIFTRITHDEDVGGLLGHVDAEALVCGHTHVQFERRLPTGLRIVNPGSVGSPYEGRRGAFWALLGPTVELRRTDYDVEAAAESIRRAGTSLTDDLARSILDPPDPVETTAYFESLRGPSAGA